MRKLVISMCVFLCLPLMLMAQEQERVATRGTVFAGYSLLHNNNSLGNGLGSSFGSSSFGGHLMDGKRKAPSTSPPISASPQTSAATPNSWSDFPS